MTDQNGPMTSFSRKFVWIVGSTLLLVTPATAQEELAEEQKFDPVAAAKETPIIVTGEREEDRKTVHGGSRIARKPLFTRENIRSNTGIAGLSPGSGMRPLSGRNPVIKKRIVTCVADNEAIGAQASCLMAEAQEAVAEGDIELGADTYRYLASSDQFSPEEQLAGGQKLYELGERGADDGLREEALIRMLEQDVLPPREARAARRTLAAMAIRREDNPLAIDRLEDVVTTDPSDARSLANLAILLRREGRDGASSRMAEAIAVLETNGQTVPKGWTDFVKQEG